MEALMRRRHTAGVLMDSVANYVIEILMHCFQGFQGNSGWTRVFRWYRMNWIVAQHAQGCGFINCGFIISWNG